MKPASTTQRRFHDPLSTYLPLLLPLAAALLVRLIAWWTLPYRGQISDEAEYLAAATWLAQGRGFSFYKEWIWTRPPVYLLFLAAHVKLFGPANLVPIRISQALISVVAVALAMAWAARLAPPGRERRVALITGWAMALSYSFATYAFLLLSETLFVALLLLGLLLLTLWAQQDAMARGRLAKTGLLAGAGIVLGLGALTRGLLAGAMPLFAFWVWWQAVRSGTRPSARLWRGLAPVALLATTVSAVILPWSLYNSRFFGGGLILIDTTGGYNAMLGAQAAHQEIDPALECSPEALRCEKAIYKQLQAMPDHAERQAVAYRTAWHWIRENPAGFARKTGRELLDLLIVNYGGAERLRGGHTQGAIPIPHLLLLLLDDTLYVLAAPLAVLGLVQSQRRPGKGLVLLWLGYNLVTGPLFFAINRFRVPLLPMLFIYGGCALAQRREPSPAIDGRARARRRAGVLGAVAMLLLLLPSFGYWRPINRNGDLSVLHNTYLGLRSRIIARGCQRAEAALRSNDLVAAQRLVDRGSASLPLDCFALLQARIDDRRDAPAKALALLQSMKREPERFLLEGDIYRRLGQRERAVGAFVAQELEPANPTAWAWHYLQPPGTTRIDLGNGLDWGYIEGFYGREYTDPTDPFGTGFRWMGPRARLRFPAAGTGQPQMLRLQLAGGPRAPMDSPARLVVTQSSAAHDDACVVDVSPGWQILNIPLAATPPGKDVVVELRSTTFVPGPQELAARQQVREQLRLLGVQVDWAEVVQASGTSHSCTVETPSTRRAVGLED